MMSSFGFVESSSSSSSVEALAFNYLSCGLLVMINHLWTLVALLTAAVSFWRFNLLPSLTRRHCLLNPSTSSSSSVVVVAAAESHTQPINDSDHQSTSSVTPPYVKADRVYSRFRYIDDVFMHHEDEAAEEEEEEDISRLAVSIISKSMRLIHDEEHMITLRFDIVTESRRRLMLWDLGFFDYQDMRVLDGNVVKLWDDDNDKANRSGC